MCTQLQATQRKDKRYNIINKLKDIDIFSIASYRNTCTRTLSK